MKEIITLFQDSPIAAVSGLLTVLVLSVAAFVIGWTVLYWCIRAITWLIPKLDAFGHSMLRLFS